MNQDKHCCFCINGYRVDKTMCGCTCHTKINAILTRISALEVTLACSEQLELRINKLEEAQSAMLTMPNVVWRKYHQTPHKCPVCDGRTHCTRPNHQDGGEINFKCLSCEGAGIVWSP